MRSISPPRSRRGDSGEPPRVGYLVGRYPAVSHAFIVREVHELRRQGIEVETFSIWRSTEDQVLSALDQEEFDRTRTLLPPRIAAYARAHARALIASPDGYLKSALSAWRSSTPGFRGRLLALAWMAQAMHLWDQCSRLGIRHIHVHFAGSAPVIANLATGFEDRRRGTRGSAWSWSITVHGPAEFRDELLGQKVEQADFVACISAFARAQVMARVNEECWSKLRVVRCGVDGSRFCPGSTAPARVEPRLNVLTVGRLVPQKGHGVLLEALATLLRQGIDLHLTVVGDGPRATALRRLARKLRVAGHVSWIGAVGQDQIRAFYRSADVFCLASFDEGVPVVLMEAMACEVPVVATRITGIPELVEDQVSGLLVPPARPDLLAQALSSVLRDDVLQRQLGAAGRERVLDAYDPRCAAGLLAERFRAQLGGAPPRAPCTNGRIPGRGERLEPTPAPSRS